MTPFQCWGPFIKPKNFTKVSSKFKSVHFYIENIHQIKKIHAAPVPSSRLKRGVGSPGVVASSCGEISLDTSTSGPSPPTPPHARRPPAARLVGAAPRFTVLAPPPPSSRRQAPPPRSLSSLRRPSPSQRRRRAPLPRTGGPPNPRLAGGGGTISSSRRGRGSLNGTILAHPNFYRTLPNAQTDSTVFIPGFSSRVHVCSLFTPAFSSRVHECSRLSLPHYDDWVTADAAPRQVPRSSSRPSPATSTNPVCPPLICPSCRAKSITQTLTYAIWLFVFGSGLFTSIYTCIMPINSIFSFCKNYILGYTYVHSCPLLAPALICSDRGLLFSINRY